jgi:peptidoglycan/xylan/chitin deacetylase (PgdA/CDA1 family)
MALTDTETTTIGVGTYRYLVEVTKAGITTPWLGGQLSVRSPAYGGPSSGTATLAITTAPTVTLTIDVTGLTMAQGDARYSRLGVEKRSGKGAVCFSWDDGYATWMSVLYPAILERGQRHTFFVETDNIGVTVTAAEVLALYDADQEIGSHSVTHYDFPNGTVNGRQPEWDDSKTALEAIVGTGNVTSFAYPYGTFNSTTNSEGLLRYDRLFGYQTSQLYPAVDRAANVEGKFFYMRRAWGQTNHDAVLNLIRLAARNPIIVHIAAHNPGASVPTANEPTVLQVLEAMDLCDSLGVACVTAAEACGSRPMLTDGGFEDSALTSWTVVTAGGASGTSALDTPDSGMVGVRSLKLTCAGGDSAYAYQTVPVEPNRSYTMSARYRLNRLSGGGTSYFRLIPYDLTGAALSGTQSSSLSSASWASASFAATMPATATECRVDFVNNGVPGDFYIDHADFGATELGVYNP